MVVTGLANNARKATDRRLSERLPLGRPGTVRTAQGARVDVSVSELTRDGCRLHTSAQFAPGTDVSIGLAHIGLTPGRIVWRGSEGYGCRFDRPLAAGTVSAAFGASNVAAFSGTTYSAPRLKSSPRAALMIVIGGAVAGWSMIAAVGWLLLR